MNDNTHRHQALARTGIAGRMAAFFQHAHITPLLGVLILLMGAFAVWVTPQEEEPQINVTMANVLVAYPGASVATVEAQIAQPAEQLLGQMAGVEHVSAQSRPGMAVMTVQFKVGVPRIEALVRLYDTVHSHADWLPANLGNTPPLIKPKGIEDVPIVTYTLFSRDAALGRVELERIAHALEGELKQVPGTREVTTVGGPGRTIGVEFNPQRLANNGLTLAQVAQSLAAANAGLPAGNIVNQGVVRLESGPFLRSQQDVEQLVIAVNNGKPVYLRDVAVIRDGTPAPSQYVWYGTAGSSGQSSPAVTLAVTKKAGENAVTIANRLAQRMAVLTNTVLPPQVGVEMTRNYGASANEKASKLIEKLVFATVSVVVLVFFSLGRREAVIVGLAVVLTLCATLFASWAWGFTLNRVSLFALIFSIGILVDDAIVVVENIHRHRQLHPDAPLPSLIAGAVDEVGGPTILATLTVIAALLPMAFVSGLMGPYMSPIPINASMGMLISLGVAFSITPWLSHRWLKNTPISAPAPRATGQSLAQRLFTPLLSARSGHRYRIGILLGVMALLMACMALPLTKSVILKMLPFDNKSELQLVVDMPSGSALEETAALLREMTDWLAQQPEVLNYQAYVGVAAPINFNGLVRQYDLRSGNESGDVMVNLHAKGERQRESHAIAQAYRGPLEQLAARYHARLKVVEVPPGPPVMAPIVAEIYGPTLAGRAVLADQIADIFRRTPGVVDIDSSVQPLAEKQLLQVDNEKAMRFGITQASIVEALATAMNGNNVTYLRDDSKYPVPVQLRLPDAAKGDLLTLLSTPLRTASGSLLPLAEVVSVVSQAQERVRYRKDGLPVDYVVADMAGRNDSPLYGMFAMQPAIAALTAPNQAALQTYFIRQPEDSYRHYAIKWDGEWQITYETFRDMGAAYAVGLVLIYLLVVAHFGSYRVPLIIMAPIPLTLIGILPGHALLGAPFTATSMIGMIALAGIIVRNSILLVDFIRLNVAAGVSLETAVMDSVATRAAPIVLTGLAAMLGAFFILDDPIFNGLAIALIFGILVSTLLTLLVIPLLYFMAFRVKTPSGVE
ncbi:efflux RND transporter permease subunit [Dickeya lacustris]|uniref:Efflux RND transporter permease subunit n=1 Tax=Dickeya lacustris TaxID=2259638 RepID=A0ABY8G0E3_9GAMM|nr:efflux RND transporter permease subunit [Dickeya lacustris]WFN54053.1 efflux RND transporter permease subunit [Dickeya lacustris]